MSEAGAQDGGCGSEDGQMPAAFDFLHYVQKLKHLDRTGWVNCGIYRPETVSGHMYRMAIMSAFLMDDNESSGLDKNKCIKMALVHDLGESVIGDITPHCGVSEEDKQQRELKAIDNLAKLVPVARGNEMRELFQEYEDCKTEEAKFIHGLDKFDMILQAYEYERREKKPRFLQAFFDSTAQFFRTTHPYAKKLAEELYRARDNDVEFSVIKP